MTTTDHNAFPNGRWGGSPITASPAVANVKPVCATLEDPEIYFVAWLDPETNQSGIGRHHTKSQAEALAAQFRVSAPHLRVWVGSVNDAVEV